MNFKKELKKLRPGMLVEITEGMTKGKTAEIDSFNIQSKKWKVNFDNEWCGWYKKEDLKIISD